MSNSSMQSVILYLHEAIGSTSSPADPTLITKLLLERVHVQLLDQDNRLRPCVSHNILINTYRLMYDHECMSAI